jgi:hypothetical protein
MLTIVTAALAPVLAESTSHGPDVNPWVVGVSIFVALAVLLLGLLAFGAGRDHS